MLKNLSKILAIIASILFIVSYIVSQSGYYEYNMQQKTVITKEKIKEFEQDIKDNKEIDLKEYLEKDKNTYSNKITTIVYNISENSNKLAKKAIKAIFKKLNSFIEE